MYSYIYYCGQHFWDFIYLWKFITSVLLQRTKITTTKPTISCENNLVGNKQRLPARSHCCFASFKCVAYVCMSLCMYVCLCVFKSMRVGAGKINFFQISFKRKWKWHFRCQSGLALSGFPLGFSVFSEFWRQRNVFSYKCPLTTVYKRQMH